MSNTTYFSTLQPSFKPQNISCGKIPAYTYKKDLKTEIADGNLTAQQAVGSLRGHADDPRVRGDDRQAALGCLSLLRGL